MFDDGDRPAETSQPGLLNAVHISVRPVRREIDRLSVL